MPIWLLPRGMNIFILNWIMTQVMSLSQPLNSKRKMTTIRYHQDRIRNVFQEGKNAEILQLVKRSKLLLSCGWS